MHRVIRRSALALVAALALLAASATAAAKPATTHARTTQQVKLIVKSDSEHGKKGPDGKWHDAFLPADFSVKAGATVKVTVLNYDEGLHSFDSPGLHLNKAIFGGSASKPKATTFTFVAPNKTGKYAWHCDPGCDPWAMTHLGYMRGIVTVTP